MTHPSSHNGGGEDSIVIEKFICTHLISCTSCNHTASGLFDENKELKRLVAGALCSLLRERWQTGPTESEMHDDLWTSIDNADDGFPLSNEKATDDSRIEYLTKIYEGKK